MKLYNHISNKTNYLHFFTASEIQDKYATVDESYFKMAKNSNSYFQGKDERLYVGNQEGNSPSEVRRFLIEFIFFNISDETIETKIILNKL